MTGVQYTALPDFEGGGGLKSGRVGGGGVDDDIPSRHLFLRQASSAK